MHNTRAQGSYRELKNRIPVLLDRDDISTVLPDLLSHPAPKLLGALYTALLNPKIRVKWHAVTAAGACVSSLADKDLEQARVVMRRFMWTLNDESGGIGWGSPECMGEIMARNMILAREYHRIFFSYLVQGDTGSDNYLEHLPLRRGAFWGLARLAQGHPELSRQACTQVQKALQKESDPEILALICLYLGLIQDDFGMSRPDPGNQSIMLYWNQQLQQVPARDLCR
ncbi:DVU0298 family protein [Desulfonatronospira sp.]|uniref:DVU0298 family protein n=1 Tax=Desulfonatronospira sp. TaxID=1962951 RepID=UPI0025C02098|nr:DVU0298 family protein [Desulfonatronospira sp.]